MVEGANPICAARTSQATRNIAGAVPPRFDYEELPDGRLLMHYHSQRGLCPVLRGLILGVGLYFNQEVQVKETAAKQGPQITEHEYHEWTNLHE